MNGGALTNFKFCLNVFKSKKYIIKGECFVRGGAKATGSGQKFPSVGDPDLRLNLK